jgi:hypothetical protein
LQGLKRHHSISRIALLEAEENGLLRKVHEAEELVWDGGLEIQFETHLVFVSLSYMIIVRLRVSRETRSSSNDLDSLAHGRRCFEKLRLVLLNS